MPESHRPASNDACRTMHPLFTSAAWQHLARHEQQLLHLPDRPVAPTLWITAHPDWAVDHARTSLLNVLYPHEEGFDGDLSSSTMGLPLERDSIQTIVVQHAGEVVIDSRDFIRELCRVLEPGGQLYWFGTNPISAWRLAACWQAQRGNWRFGAHGMRHVDHCLAAHAVDAIDSRYLGSLLPRPRPPNAARRHTVVDGLRAAWLLSARKQRATLTPLRARMTSPRRIAAFDAVPSSRVRR